MTRSEHNYTEMQQDSTGGLVFPTAVLVGGVLVIATIFLLLMLVLVSHESSLLDWAVGAGAAVLGLIGSVGAFLVARSAYYDMPITGSGLAFVTSFFVLAVAFLGYVPAFTVAALYFLLAIPLFAVTVWERVAHSKSM